MLSVSSHSTQLTLITADCAVVKVFNLIICIDMFTPYGQAIHVYVFPQNWLKL